MSPFLYILMLESLSRKLEVEQEAGYLLGIKIASGVDPTNNAFLRMTLSYLEELQ